MVPTSYDFTFWQIKKISCHIYKFYNNNCFCYLSVRNSNNYSVLDLDAFERTNKAEGLGMSSDANAGETNLYDADITCKLFRFLQLLCEGHNAGKLKANMEWI